MTRKGLCQHLIFEVLSPFGDIDLLNFHKDQLISYAQNMKNHFWKDVLLSYGSILKEKNENA